MSKEEDPIPPAVQVILDRARMCHEVQSGYGRWLIATLVLIHGALIGYGANQDALRTVMAAKVLCVPAAGFLTALVGLLAALFSGIGAWYNWAPVRQYWMRSPWLPSRQR